MGNNISREQLISIENVADITAHSSYMVKRTSGIIEPGWTIGPSANNPYNLYMNAWFDPHKQIWRIYMHNGKQDEGWLCGWRSFETIHPESLSANEIPAWRKKVLTQLAALEKERIDLLNLG